MALTAIVYLATREDGDTESGCCIKARNPNKRAATFVVAATVNLVTRYINIELPPLSLS
jgi:hypothetical protein